MKKVIAICLLCVLLTPLMIAANTVTIVTEEVLGTAGYWSIDMIGSRPYESTNGERSLVRNRLVAPEPVLRLPFALITEVFVKPDEVPGIERDIPFNYYSSLELSAKFLAGLVNGGFVISYYESTPRVIYLEVTRGDVRGRILIYENYLKVYLPEERERIVNDQG